MKSLYLISILLVALGLTACAGGDGNKTGQENTNTGNIAGWELEVTDFSLDESLENISTTIGYDGTAQSDKVNQQASEGKQFLLIKLLAEKKEGSTVIKWDNFTVKDGAGNTAKRMDDAFLTDLGFKRMTSNDLNFGSNEGWVAFEVDKDSKDFTLEYASDEGNVTLVVKK